MTEQQEKNPRVNPPPIAFETRSEERSQLRALRRQRLQEKRSRRKSSKTRQAARPLPYRDGGPQRWGEWNPSQDTREVLEPNQDIPPHIHRFFRKLHLATPRTFVSESIIVLNVVIFAVMLAYGVHLLTPQAQQLVDWGANYGPQTLSGQWWRLLTATFLHAGIFHLLINMWVLWDLREIAERLTGPVGFFVLYLFAGVMGSLASLFWNPTTPSVGASGAIFGVFGGLLSFVWVNRESIPREILQSLRSSAMTIFILNLVISIGASNIDTAGHIGGLMAGLGAGSILSQPVSEQMRKSRAIRNMLLLIIASLVIAISWSLLPKEAGALMRFASLSEQIERSSYARFSPSFRRISAKKDRSQTFCLHPRQRDLTSLGKDAQRCRTDTFALPQLRTRKASSTCVAVFSLPKRVLEVPPTVAYHGRGTASSRIHRAKTLGRSSAPRRPTRKASRSLSADHPNHKPAHKASPSVLPCGSPQHSSNVLPCGSPQHSSNVLSCESSVSVNFTAISHTKALGVLSQDSFIRSHDFSRWDDLVGFHPTPHKGTASP